MGNLYTHPLIITFVNTHLYLPEPWHILFALREDALESKLESNLKPYSSPYLKPEATPEDTPKPQSKRFLSRHSWRYSSRLVNTILELLIEFPRLSCLNANVLLILRQQLVDVSIKLFHSCQHLAVLLVPLSVPDWLCYGLSSSGL